MNYKNTYWWTIDLRDINMRNKFYIMIDKNYKRYVYRPGRGWEQFNSTYDELNWRMISEEELILELL